MKFSFSVEVKNPEAAQGPTSFVSAQDGAVEILEMETDCCGVLSQFPVSGQSFLTASVASNDSTIIVADAEAAGLLKDKFCFIDDEVLRITARNGNNLTVERAV
eukprot:2521131-Rhodomonas_salina.1